MSELPERWRKVDDRKLGEGGQAPVFLVKDALGEHKGQLALKLLPYGATPKARARFAQEVETIRSLDHPNVIRILAYSSADEEPTSEQGTA